MHTGNGLSNLGQSYVDCVHSGLTGGMMTEGNRLLWDWGDLHGRSFIGSSILVFSLAGYSSSIVASTTITTVQK